MSAAIAPNPNDPQAPLGTPSRPWWVGYVRELHLDIPLAVESGGTGKNTPLDASDIAETSTLKILTADERTKLTGIAEGANNYTHPATHPQSMIEGLGTALAAKAAAADLTTHTGNTSNPHGVTKAQVGLGSVDNTSDIDKPVSTAQAAAIAASRPKHAYTGISGSPAAIAAERGNTYGINANGCTLTLPDVTTSGYVDGDEICVLLGVTLARTLTITSPSWVVRGSGRQPKNTPFTLTGHGTVISFTRCTNQWSMSYPEYELGLKAPLASPALTGTPTAPTAAPGTNTQQIATTAFVQAKAAGALLMEGTPSGPTATGTKGMARFDADCFYVCTATNTWVRFAKDGSWT